MQIAFIGLGRLGFPCAVALATRGHNVFAYDKDRHLVAEYQRGWVTPFEPGLQEQYDSSRKNMTFCGSVDEAVAKSDYIFVAVPTPHRPTHDGSFPFDDAPRNFDNSMVRSCLEEIGRAIAKNATDGRFRTVLVMSTVTPRSMADELAPALQATAGARVGDGYTIVYNPFFLGQSTVVRDFLNPEFVLLGCPSPAADAGESEHRARELFATLHSQPICPMTWTEAECVKLCYNTYLGLKVLFANTVMELCHKMPDASCDVVTSTLKLAKDRLMSPKYMDGGMADGGPSHGRDQMAMSYAARQAGLTFNLFDTINHGRDAQTGWLADLIGEHRRGRPVVLLGMAFKAGTNQLEGSPAMLLANILRQRGLFVQMHDPAIRPDAKIPDGPCLYFISTRWSEYTAWPFKPGDTVIDPWRMIKSTPDGVELISVGAPKPAALVETKSTMTTSRPLAAAG